MLPSDFFCIITLELFTWNVNKTKQINWNKKYENRSLKKNREKDGSTFRPT